MPQSNGPPKPRSNKCYGCFDETHIMRDCPKLAKLQANGVIQYNPQTRKYCLPNGDSLYRRSEESLIQTVERITGTTIRQNQVNFVTLASGVSDFWAKRVENEDGELCWPDTDSEDDGPYWRYAQPAAVRGEYPTYQIFNQEQDIDMEDEDSEEYVRKVYPVERAAKRTTETRKDVTRGPAKTKFDGVQVPERLKTRSSGPAPDIPKEQSRQRNNFNKPDIRPSENTNLPAVLEPIPVDVRKPRFNSLQDVPMGDPEIFKERKPEQMMQKSKVSGKTLDHHDKSRSGPRQSELKTQVDVNAVLDEILDTPVPLTIRKILGTSKELSTGMQD